MGSNLWSWQRAQPRDQSLKGPAQGIELVVHDIHTELLFVGVHDCPGPDGQEARGNDLLTTLWVGFPGQNVSRDLLLNKAIVGLVGIERIDDVIAVSPGLPCRDAATLPQTVGIARQIEPVPSPALAESGRSQKPVNDVLEREFGIVAGKRLDVFGLRKETDEIEVDPSQ